MSDTNEGDLLLELAAHSSQLITYRKTIAAILDRSQGTLDLVSFIHVIAALLREELTEMWSYSRYLNIETMRP